MVKALTPFPLHCLVYIPSLCYFSGLRFWSPRKTLRQTVYGDKRFLGRVSNAIHRQYSGTFEKSSSVQGHLSPFISFIERVEVPYLVVNEWPVVLLVLRL